MDVRTIVIIDYCKYHEYYHPFSTDTSLRSSRARPVHLDKSSDDKTYEVLYIFMAHKRGLLMDVESELLR